MYRCDLASRNPENETAIEAVNAFANHLAARFDPTVGCTRSWDSADPTDFQVGRESSPNTCTFKKVSSVRYVHR